MLSSDWIDSDSVGLWESDWHTRHEYISSWRLYFCTFSKYAENTKVITNSGGYNKYTIKYNGNIDAQNYVIVYTDIHKNGNLVTKCTFLHNKKVSASKKN